MAKIKQITLPNGNTYDLLPDVLDGVTSNVQNQLNSKASSSHTHNYAGSSSAGGAATSANKLNTNAGSATQPVYFEGGVPKATTYTLGKSVPANAVFTDTTYSTGTASKAGLTKLYTATGTNTDGSMTQAAITSSLSEIDTKAINAQDTANAMPDYIASRGENLITNGTCLLGDNTNFSRFQYDGQETYYAGGSFKHSGKYAYMETDEYIPVDVEQKYELSYYIKSSSASALMYDFISLYDIDKEKIDPTHVMFIPGSTTTLAKELKNGDTKVYLTSVSGFNKTTSHQAQRGLIFWNYTNSKGYTYKPETYSRNQFSLLWSDSSAFDESANTITLDSAWNRGTFPAGTSVSQSNSGAGYIYGNIGYAVEANAWTKKTASWSGVGRNNASKKFREGTAYARVGWLLNYNNNILCDIWLSTISFTQSANNTDIDNLTTRITSVETKITQNSEEIALRAKKTEVEEGLNSKGSIFYSSTEPTSLAAGDVWFKLLN